MFRIPYAVCIQGLGLDCGLQEEYGQDQIMGYWRKVKNSDDYVLGLQVAYGILNV